MAPFTYRDPEGSRTRARAGLLAAVLALAGAERAAAEFRSTEDLQYWAPTFLHAPRRGGFLGSLELNPRARGDLGRLNHLLVRPWLGWKLAPWLDGHVGYAWVRNDTGRVNEEHRVWQQATFKGAGIGPTLSLRARLEQRWLEALPRPSWRGRAMLRAERPLRAGPWYIAVYDEPFVHLASPPGGPAAGIDQNRLFVGVGRKGADRSLVEFGYQHWWLRRPGASDAVFHVLVLMTHWDLNRWPPTARTP